MKELKLIDRVVVEIKCEEGSQSRNTQMAALLQDVSEQILNGMKGNESLHTSPIGIHTEVLWERECTDFGFRMGNKSLISMHYYGSEKKDEFPVITLMREDLEQKGFDTSNLGDEWMEKIASKVGDILLDSDYWDHLVWAAEYYKVPRKEEEQ